MKRPSFGGNIISRPPQTPRPSIPATRRSAQTIRSPDHIALCTSTLENFISSRTSDYYNLTSPSAKEVVLLFKFVYMHFEENYIYKKFEDDVLNICRTLRYPYIGEINKSQFVAVTPHAWPAIISMLAWLADLVDFVSGFKYKAVVKVFFEHVSDNYVLFMSGDEERPDDLFVSRVNEMYGGAVSDVEWRIEVLRGVESEIEEIVKESETDIDISMLNIGGGSVSRDLYGGLNSSILVQSLDDNASFKDEINNRGNSISKDLDRNYNGRLKDETNGKAINLGKDLDKNYIASRSLHNKTGKSVVDILAGKKKGILEDGKSLARRKKQLQEKKKKYLAINDKLQRENIEIEEEISKYKKRIEKLKQEISEQKIKPEEIASMNKEKVEMYNELERIKPQKEKLINELNFTEKTLSERNDEVEKLIFDLQSISSSKIPLKMARSNEEFIIEGNISEYNNIIEDEAGGLKRELSELETEKSILEVKKLETLGLLKDMNEKVKHLDNKLIDMGKLYLEKKELYEIERRKAWSNLNEMESEMLKLNVESNHAVLVSEQRLQMSKIKFERKVSAIKNEIMEIENIVADFNSFVVEQHKIIKSIITNL